jgi:hypothetical protein
MLKRAGGAEQQRLSTEKSEHLVHAFHPLALPCRHDNGPDFLLFICHRNQFEFSILALDFE